MGIFTLRPFHPNQKNENMEEYLERILKPLNNRKVGLIFAPWVEDIKGPSAVIESWHSLRDVTLR